MNDDYFDVYSLTDICPTICREGSMGCACDCPPGWRHLVTELSIALEAHAVSQNRELIVDQIKEKFGGLRYYVSNSDEIADALISAAEQKSFKMCMVCGEEGEKSKATPWSEVLCKKHEKEARSK